LGALLALVYSMLFNDLFIAFLLLPLSFDRESKRVEKVPAASRRPRRVKPPARRAVPAVAS
jgi:hypothetical protein